MTWQPIDTAPKDGTTILVWDGFGVIWARYHPKPSLEDFHMICDDGEGQAEYEEWLTQLRESDYDFCDEWEVGPFDTREEIAECSLMLWLPLPEPPV